MISGRSPAHCLAVLGTGSDVGKSIGVAALACLPPDCQDRIAGFAINRFRGDISLLQVCDEASHGLHFFE